MEILRIEDVMKIVGCGKKYATQLLTTPGCPVLPRTKGQKFLIEREAFETWLKNGGKNGKAQK